MVRREGLTKAELVRAAEAVVDAAVLFHSMRGGGEISPQTRGLLVRVILEDPLLTEELFLHPERVLH
jgi:hypothetical protein